MDDYIQWLKQSNEPIFEAGGAYWRSYQDALIPASLKPQPVELTRAQANQLLERSGALFLRYFSTISEKPTDFWYTACTEYNFKKVPQKLRTQVRRAYKDCRVELVDASWLSENGYQCYANSFTRLRSAQPDLRVEFDQMCRGAERGPFEFWGVFVANKLVGFNKYVVGADYAAGVVLKLDPEYLYLNPALAMEDTILNKYVAEQGKSVTIGFRSVLQETNRQRFLQQFGYRRIYCDLKLVYKPSLKAAVKLSYPFRALLDRIPKSEWNSKIRALLAQEAIRRSFNPDGKRAARWREPILYRIARSIWGNHYGTTLK
jgi:hypothetical protein